jgi:hypothetical protein
MKKREINKDYYGGALMILIGLGATFEGASYHLGTLIRTGPGFFPTAIGILLVVTGAIIAIEGINRANVVTAEARGQAEWRGWLCILGGIVAFIVLGKYTGLLPATFAVVFISALGDKQNTVKAAVLLASAMCVIAIVVFWWMLQLQFPLLTWGQP